MTLDSTFKLYDKYSSTADKIIGKTDRATDKIIKASGATDKFNSKLQATGASAGSASGGLIKLLSIAGLIAGVFKGMEVTDTFTNTSARLDLINDGLQTQAELQQKIFEAADRSKGAYSSMASAISKIGLLAGDQFSTNDELIAFTELLQKSFKVGGASSSEQSSALLQLSQAMAAGKLQGDEFRSIMENAPMIADAIAKYTGKSKGELKEMSAEGTITADIIKKAMFAASDDINDKFNSMPYTFADIWNKIKNGGTKAFSGLMQKINKLVNTDKFQDLVDDIIGGLSLAANVAGWLIDVIVNGWDIIGPIFAIITGVYFVYMITQLWAMVPPLIAQAAAWLSIYWPVLLVIGIIVLAVMAARYFGATWEQIFGFVGGIIGVFAAHVYNKFAMIWNFIANFVNFIGNVFKDPVASMQILFLDMADTVLGYIEVIAQAIEDVINAIPGVEVDITGGISKLRDDITQASSKIKDKSGWVEYAKTLDYMDYSEAMANGSKIGAGIARSVGDAFNNLTNSLSGFGKDNDPIVVEGTGSGGQVQVFMEAEDIQYLRDLAERDYINKFSTATLAPNVTISFGDVYETADADKVRKRIEEILREEIAVAAEG